MNTPIVLVVGAGPTGMSMAIELKRAGLDVRVIDKSPHPALYSQALVVQARTLEQFQRYGIASKAVAQGRKLTRAVFWSEGNKILSFALDRIPSRYPYALFLPQNETEAILNDHMESLGVKSERGVELVSLSQQDEGVTSILRHADGRQEEFTSRWIVGCDGAHSAVRERLSIPFEGKGIGLSFFLADAEIEGPDAPTDEISLHLHAGDVAFMGRLTDRFTRLIVALHAQQDERHENNLTIADFQNAVDRAGIRIKIQSAKWMTPFHVNDRQAKHYRLQNAFLAGDAAHIHSPVGGQGMNTGIQDAANLAWKLAAVARGADDQLLDSYELERGEVGKALLRFTERGLKLATASNWLVEHVRDAVLPLITKSKAVQDMMLGFISETAIEYRSSSVVADHGGDGSLRAGDRLPDLNVVKNGQQSTLLQDWHDGKHLAVLIEATEAEKEKIEKWLGSVTMISISRAALDEQGRRLLGVEKKLVLMRPDGYVGFRGPVDKGEDLEAYARQDGLGDGNLATESVGRETGAA